MDTMTKLTGKWSYIALGLLLLIIVGSLTQLYLKDNLKVGTAEAHGQAHTEEPTATEQASTEVAMGNDLLLNGSFEVGTDLSIDYWMPSGEDPGTSAWRDTTISKYGFSSATLLSRDNSRGVELTWTQNVLKPPAGKDVTVKGSIKTEGLRGNAFLRVAGAIQTEQFINYMVWLDLDAPAGTSDWQEVEGSLYIPSEVNVLEVSVGIDGEGRAWFDGLSLKASEPVQAPLPRDVNLLANPDFSQGTLFWYFFSIPGTPKVDWGIANGGDRFGPCIYLTQPFPIDKANYSGFFQVINNLYRTRDEAVLSGWVKTDSLEGEAFLSLVFYGSDLKAGVETDLAVSGTQGWQRLELRVQVPENSDSVWVRIITNGKGTAYFDDLDFRLVPPGS
jgi:hypothetical protein